MAPPDVIAALVPLLETGSLTIASRGERLQAADGFQLLATITSAPSSSAAGGTHAVSGGGGGAAYASFGMAKVGACCTPMHTRYSTALFRLHGIERAPVCGTCVLYVFTCICVCVLL